MREYDFIKDTTRLDQILGIGQVFDISKREFIIDNKQAILYFMPFLVNASDIIDLFFGFYMTEESSLPLTSKMAHQSITLEQSLDKVALSILEGLVAVVIEGENDIYLLDSRNYPSRGINEPETEKVVRGSRDGFCETMAINIALVRRRIKTGNLRTKLYRIGKLSETNVALIYLEDYVDKKALKSIEKALDRVDIVELTMTDKALEEIVIGHKYTPYPLVRYTERPDTFSAHLYQGMFGLIVDNSPSAILGPVSIFDHMQHAEEFRQTPIAGTYLRILRFIGILASFLLMPLWYMCIKMDYLPFPSKLFEIDSSENLFLQVILIEVGIELLRMASIHTPNALSTSMGLIAGIVIGNIAIELEIFTNAIVFVGAISAIGTYITPSYELGLANKILKIALLFFIYLFDFWGLVAGIVFLIIYLASLKSFDRSYLFPLIPFNFKQLVKQVIRVPYQNKHPKRK
ncbi:MAG: spore germination protein [Bacilli bacterium]|nr:spore germination protein [Bacilli bacterium]